MRKVDPVFDEPLHVGRPNIGDQALLSKYIEEIVGRRWLSNDGPLVRQLEEELRSLLGVKHVVAMANGTLALEALVAALDLKGEVLVPSFTFVATVHSLLRAGLSPVFVDIDPDTHALDPASVERSITPETRAILPVHLWGRPSPIQEYAAIAEEHNLEVLYDAAHAFASSWNGVSIGNFGRAEVFSFHATKFFNTFEGGAVTTNDDALAKKLRLYRNFGFAGEDDVIQLGTNAKMTEVCAAMGLVNLASLDRFISVNQRNFAEYSAQLTTIPGIDLFDPGAERVSANYQYVVALVRNGNRDRALDALRANNVLARKYFWPGVHRMEPYRTMMPDAGHRLPHTVAVAEEVLVLPTGSAIAPGDIRAIGDIIRGVLE